MFIRFDENFNKDEIIGFLKTLDYDDGCWFIPIVEFVFSEYGCDIFDEINSKFKSILGPPAIDRWKLFLGLSYGSKFEIGHDLTKVAKLCRLDKVLKKIMGGDTPL